MQNIDSDLIRGNIDTIILKTMLNEDKYGLDIIKEVSDKSSGTYVLKQPTLYSCLKRLENQELISSYWVDSDIGGKRHYYKLTDKGREFYNKKQEEWAKSKFIIDNLLSNYNHEEYRLVKKDEYDEILQNKANAPIAPVSENQQVSDTIDINEDENDNEELEENLPSTDEDELDNLPAQDENDSFALNDDEPLQDEDFELEKIYDFEEEHVSLGGNNFNDEFESEDLDDTTTNIDDDYPVYFSAKASEPSETATNDIYYESSDQSSNELNILNRLRDMEDETINTYYGDQKSYVNHLNQLDESQIEQQNILDSSLYVRPDEVNQRVDEFTSAIEQLNNFNSNGNDFEESNDEEEFSDETEPLTETQESNNDEIDEDYDDLDELHSLKNISSNSFFESDDIAAYNTVTEKPHTSVQELTTFETETNNFNFAFAEEKSSPMSFDEISHEIEPEETNETYECENVFEDENYDSSAENMKDIDAIISNNITTSYAEPTYAFYRTQTTNYKDKLSDLSKYSRVTLEQNETETNNEDALNKAKDIAEITKELEEEGIKVKEHYKQLNSNRCDKKYLLSNKISFIKSLIIFFGYVFILSATYIVLNNTSVKDNSWFNIKPFLLGFIPFAAVLLYHGIKFIINPYKKIESKFHFRIMLFISLIITIQLLLITYCLNLQLGFYSFTQQGYNHLYWIVPTIISFAPVIDNLVYLALYKSKNFHV